MFGIIYRFVFKMFLIVLPAVSLAVMTAFAIVGFISRWWLLLTLASFIVVIIWYNIRAKREHEMFITTERATSIDKRDGMEE